MAPSSPTTPPRDLPTETADDGVAVPVLGAVDPVRSDPVAVPVDSAPLDPPRVRTTGRGGARDRRLAARDRHHHGLAHGRRHHQPVNPGRGVRPARAGRRDRRRATPGRSDGRRAVARVLGALGRRPLVDDVDRGRGGASRAGRRHAAARATPRGRLRRRATVRRRPRSHRHLRANAGGRGRGGDHRPCRQAGSARRIAHIGVRQWRTRRADRRPHLAAARCRRILDARCASAVVQRVRRPGHDRLADRRRHGIRH